MSDHVDTDRRPFLRAVGTTGLVVLGAVSGCTTTDDGPETTTDPGDGDTATLDPFPAGDFYFEFDESEGTLSITYLGGQYVPADKLDIRGENLGGASGVWIDFPGAEASATVDGVPALGSQDSVTLGAANGQEPVEPDYVVELLLLRRDGSQTIVGSDSGPDA